MCNTACLVRLSKQLVANASLCGADTKDNGVYDSSYVLMTKWLVHTLHENEGLYQN